MLLKNDKPLAAISYDTRTYAMLCELVSRDDPDIAVLRIDPNDFEKSPDPTYQYVNLVNKDWEQRKRISKILDEKQLDRFSYISQDIASHNNTTFGNGCVIFAGLGTYYGTIGNDVMMHGRVSLAEGVSVGNGCFFSGLVTVAGDSHIGDFCYIGTSVVILDHVKICSDVKLLPGTSVKKDITEPGKYYNPFFYRIEKMRDIQHE